MKHRAFIMQIRYQKSGKFVNNSNKKLLILGFQGWSYKERISSKTSYVKTENYAH